MSEASAGSIDVAIGVEDGKVIARWHIPSTMIAFDPQNAFNIGEALARAAHEARFPGEALTDGSYLAAQIRARITEDVRDRLVTRVALMLNSLRASRHTNGELALQIVDVILVEVG